MAVELYIALQFIGNEGWARASSVIVSIRAEIHPVLPWTSHLSAQQKINLSSGVAGFMCSTFLAGFTGVHRDSFVGFFKTRFFVRTGDSTCIGDSSSGFTGFTLGVHGIHLGIHGIHFKTCFFASLGIHSSGFTIQGSTGSGFTIQVFNSSGLNIQVQQLGIQYSGWFNETQSAPTDF